MQKNAIDVGGIKEKQNNFCVAINHINAEISTKGEGMILCRIMFWEVGVGAGGGEQYNQPYGVGVFLPC